MTDFIVCNHRQHRLKYIWILLLENYWKYRSKFLVTYGILLCEINGKVNHDHALDISRLDLTAVQGSVRKSRDWNTDVLVTYWDFTLSLTYRATLLSFLTFQKLFRVWFFPSNRQERATVECCSKTGYWEVFIKSIPVQLLHFHRQKCRRIQQTVGHCH